MSRTRTWLSPAMVAWWQVGGCESSPPCEVRKSRNPYLKSEHFCDPHERAQDSQKFPGLDDYMGQQQKTKRGSHGTQSAGQHLRGPWERVGTLGMLVTQLQGCFTMFQNKAASWFFLAWCRWTW